MIDFLPLEEKNKILLEGRIKSVCVIFILFSVYLIFSMIFLLPTMYYLNKEAEKLEEKTGPAKQTVEIFKSLNGFYAGKFYFAGIIEKISGIFPSGTYLTNLSIIPIVDKEDKITGFNVSAMGFSPSREKLIELKANVQKEGSFKGVNFLMENWTKPNDIDFSFSFKIS